MMFALTIVTIIGLVLFNGLWRVADAATDAVTKPKRKGRRKKK